MKRFSSFITIPRLAFVASCLYFGWNGIGGFERAYQNHGLGIALLSSLPILFISFAVAFGVAITIHGLGAGSDHPAAGPGRHGDGGGGY